VCENVSSAGEVDTKKLRCSYLRKANCAHSDVSELREGMTRHFATSVHYLPPLISVQYTAVCVLYSTAHPLLLRNFAQGIVCL
jgi:hypothetical protein